MFGLEFAGFVLMKVIAVYTGHPWVHCSVYYAPVGSLQCTLDTRGFIAVYTSSSVEINRN